MALARPELRGGGGSVEVVGGDTTTVRQIATVYGTATVDGTDYPLVIGGSTPEGVESSETGVEVATDRYNKAAIAKLTVLAKDELEEGVAVDISIRDTPIFSGTVRKSRAGAGDRQRLTAYDAIYELKRANMWASYDQQKYSQVVDDALFWASLEDGNFWTTIDGTIDLSSVANDRITTEYEGQRTDKVLEQVAKWANAAWWVDPENTVVFTDKIGTHTETYDLAWIRDTSPGKETPAYQSVHVTGGTAVSRRGLPYRHLISSQPVTATAGSGDPTFYYEDNNIQSQAQADRVAKKLYQRLQAQQKGGWVEVVGREDVRPFDTVVMPDAYGGEEYLVSEVKHTIDDSDGFVTKLTLGGLIEA